MGKRNRRARRNLEQRQAERLVDKPQAPGQWNDTEKTEGSFSVSDTILGNAPAATGQHEAQKSTDSIKYRQYIVRFGVAIWRFVKWALTDAHAGAVSALATVAIVILTFVYVKYSKRQWETMRETLAVTQRAHVTIGKKDGTVADLIIPRDPTANAGIVLYFQNSGHTPARFNWGPFDFPTNFSGPVITLRSKHKWIPMTRTRNRKNGSTNAPSGSGSVIRAESMDAEDFGELTQEQVAKISHENKLFWIVGAYEYCDELGTYACRQFTIFYQGAPYNSFRLLNEVDCPVSIRSVEHPDRDVEYLPPCKTPEERQQRQDDGKPPVSLQPPKR